MNKHLHIHWYAYFFYQIAFYLNDDLIYMSVKNIWLCQHIHTMYNVKRKGKLRRIILIYLIPIIQYEFYLLIWLQLNFLNISLVFSVCHIKGVLKM